MGTDKDSRVNEVMLELIKIQQASEKEVIQYSYVEDGLSITQIARILQCDRKAVREHVRELEQGKATKYDAEISKLALYVKNRMRRNAYIAEARSLGVKAKDIAKLFGFTERHIYRIARQELEKH